MHEFAELVGPRSLNWISSSVDERPLEAHEIRCRTRYTTISPGTEVAAFVGLPPLRPGPVYPRLVGYCNLAEVQEVGEGVTSVKPGEMVITHQSHRSGFICSEDAVLALVDRDLDLPSFSATYIFHLGYAALQKAGFSAGHSVAVIGLGAVGLGTVAVAASCGGLVTAFSDQTAIGAKAEEVGAEKVCGKNTDIGSAASQFDVVVTTSNSWSDWKLALEAVRQNGVIAVLGFPGRGQGLPAFNPIASEYLYDKQITVVGAGMVPNLNVRASDLRFTVKRNMQWLVKSIENGKLPVRAIVSEIKPARDLENIYERLAVRDPQLITAALEW